MNLDVLDATNKFKKLPSVLKPNLDDFTFSKFALYQGYHTTQEDVVSLYIKDYTDDDMVIELRQNGTCKIFKKKVINKCKE